MDGKLKFAVMCGNLTLCDWQFKCLKELCAVTNVELVLCINNKVIAKRKPHFNWSLFSIYNFFVEKKAKALKKVSWSK